MGRKAERNGVGERGWGGGGTLRIDWINIDLIRKDKGKNMSTSVIG